MTSMLLHRHCHEPAGDSIHFEVNLDGCFVGDDCQWLEARSVDDGELVDLTERERFEAELTLTQGCPPNPLQMLEFDKKTALSAEERIAMMIERNETRIIKYDITEAQIELKRVEYSQLAPVVDNKTRDISAKARADIRTARVNVEKRRKELKADAIEWGRLVDAKAKELTGLLEQIEEPIELQIKAFDDAKEAEKRAEEERKKAELEAKIRAEQEAEAARLLAIRQEEERKLAEERARIAAEQARLDEQKRKQDEEARLAREAIEREQAAARAKIEQERRQAQEAARVEAKRIEATRLEQETKERKAREAAEAQARAEQAERNRLAKIESDRIIKERAELKAAQAQFKADQEAAVRAEQERLDRLLAEEQAKQRSEQLAREQEEALVAEAERKAELVRRMEALRPDRDKLAGYAAALLAVPLPELTDPESRIFLQYIENDLSEITGKLERFGQAEATAAE